MFKLLVARAFALAGLLALAPHAYSQSLEIYAGQGRFVDSPGNTVGMQPGAMAAAPDGYIYLSDINGRFFRLNAATGLVTALPATSGGLNHNVGYTYGIAVNGQGETFIGAQGALHRVNGDGTLTNVGSMAYSGPMAFAADGSLYLIPAGDSRVFRRLPSGEFQLVAGSEETGYSGDGGPAIDARFNGPEGIAVGPNGDVYIADTNNHRIRVISAIDGSIASFAGDGTSNTPILGVPASQTPIPRPLGLTFDATGNLYLGSWNSYRLLRIDRVSGLVTSIAGTGTSGMTGDGGPATSARISWPRFLTVDPAGNLFFSDYSTYHYIRRIDAASGVISQAVGMSAFVHCGVENTPASQQCLGIPRGLAETPAGDLLVTDSIVRSIKKIAAGSRLMSTHKYVPSGSPYAVEYDAAGNLFYIDWGGGYFVDRIDAVTGATSRLMSGVIATDLAVDAAGNLFVTDPNTRFIRRIDAVTGASSVFLTSLYANGIDFDRAGNLIVSGGQITCSIYRVDVATKVVTRIAGTGTCTYGDPPTGAVAASSGLGRTDAFAVEPDGNILLAWSQRLYRINTTTGLISRINAPNGGYLTTPEGVTFTSPDRMELDRAGNVFLSQNGTGNRNFVFRISGVRDATPPVITPSITGTEGTAGWYRSTVSLSWSVADPDSVITSSTGCSSNSVTEDTVGVTFTCSATSSGGTTTQSVTIKRDTVAPTLNFGAASPEANASGWNNTAVSVPFVAEDALSGVYITSSGSPVLLNTEGAGITAQVTVTDFAGNSASVTTPSFNLDWSAPQITPHTTGTMGGEGWYTSDVHVAFDVVDPHSPVELIGCTDQDITSDTSLITINCIARSQGGETSAAAYVKRDTTPPALTFGEPTPAPNAQGWNTTDVSFPFTVSDSGSLPIPNNPDSPAVVNGSGAGLTTSVTVWDRAGNSTTLSTPPVNIDRSTPTVAPVVTGTLGNSGWYTSDVQVSWAITGNILSSTGCEDSTVAADTAGVTFSCSVIAGSGTASSSVTLKRDATAPVLTFGTPSPAPNVNGWNKTNVSIPFTRSDALSGLASTSTASPLVLSTEGAGVTGQVVVTDLAGNTATFTTVARNIDKAAPVVAITTPANGASFGFYQDVTSDFSCSDLSLLSCVGTAGNGEPVNTKNAGARTFKVTGKDLALFTTSVTNSFTVASLFNFEGFLAPTNDPPTLNLVMRGSLVPIRWQLPDGNGGFVTNPASFTSATVGSLSCGSATVAPYPDTASGPAGISFDAATNSFVYNWQTSASWTGCRKLTIKLRDNTLHELRFRFQ